MALSTELKNFVRDLKDSKLDGLHISDRSGLELLGAMLNYLESRAKLILWSSGVEGLNGTTANTDAASIATDEQNTVTLSMSDASDTEYPLSQDNQVTITLSGTSSSQTIDIGDGNGQVAGPVTATLLNGKATMTTQATYTNGQTLILTLSAPTAGKTADGTYTITAS